MQKKVPHGLLLVCIIVLIYIVGGYAFYIFATSPVHSNFVETNGTALQLDGRPYTLTGINYYPKNTPWDKFWMNYNDAVTDYDFTLINRLQINAVRIFIPFYTFGGAEVGSPTSSQTTSSVTIVQQPLIKLEQLIRCAHKHHLHLIVTLFDLYTDYRVTHWSQTARYLQTILTHFSNEPTILAWDLKNEPDLDYPAWGKKLVDAWLTYIAHLTRRYDPNHLLTIGWSNSVAAQTLIQETDFVSFHYYLSAPELPQAYTKLRKVIPMLPILLTEFGLPTSKSVATSTVGAEAAQKQYYTSIFQYWHTVQSPGAFCWTLYDFTYIPSFFGANPQQIDAQKHFGLIRDNNTFKPVAALFNIHIVTTW